MRKLKKHSFILGKSRMKKLHKKMKAFSMMDIMVAMVIIGILASMALPDNTSLIAEAKMMEAQNQLKHVVTLEKLFQGKYSKYSGDLKEIRFNAPTLISEGGNANYKIELVEATVNGFKARATSISDFDGDGVFNVWEITQEDKLIETVQD